MTARTPLVATLERHVTDTQARLVLMELRRICEADDAREREDDESFEFWCNAEEAREMAHE